MNRDGRADIATAGGGEPAAPDLTVLICTFNRAAELEELLRSVLAQGDPAALRFEVVVVDNNSSDGTRRVVEGLMAGHPHLRYLFERRQGKSYALNTGLEAVRGTYCAVIDDDQMMPAGYLEALLDAFRGRPELAFVGGKVLPVWEEAPPAWLTSRHWSPLGMLDHGDEAFEVGEQRQICLLTFAFRVADVRALGGFRQELGVTGNLIGSTEDADLIERLWRSGRRGLYLPALVLRHRAPARRTTREYYRRWHRGHGRFSALRRDEAVERSIGSLFGVPAHLYRQAASDLLASGACSIRGQWDRAFDHQLRLSFFRGFFEERYSGSRGQRPHGAVREILDFARHVLIHRREGSRARES